MIAPVIRRPPKALTENQLYVRYQGSCSNVRATIAESFVNTMSHVLHDEHGPCQPDFLCNIEEVRVICGQAPMTAASRAAAARAAASGVPSRKRRQADAGPLTDDVAEDEGELAVVILKTSAELNRLNASTVSVQDQEEIMETLDGLSEAVWQKVIDMETTDDVPEVVTESSGRRHEDSGWKHNHLMVTEMKEVSRQWETISCRDGEVADFDGTSDVCCKYNRNIDTIQILIQSKH